MIKYINTTNMEGYILPEHLTLWHIYWYSTESHSIHSVSLYIGTNVAKLIMWIKIQSIISINSVEEKCSGNLIKVTFMTSLSRVLFREAESTLGRNRSSLKIDKIRKASSVEMSSLPCWPKLWKTRNYLSKTAAITNLRLSIHYMLEIRFPKYILFIFLISIVYA